MTVAHSTRSHARLAPSSAFRWLNCPGSVRLSDGIEEAPSSFANEGTAAHMLAERCLQSGHDAERYRGYVVDTALKDGDAILQHSKVKADGVTRFDVDSEMIEGVQLHLDVARTIADESEDCETEQRLELTMYAPGEFGTGDVIAYRSEPTRRVTVVDLKYGKGVAVDVKDNAQLLTYAAEVAARWHNSGVDEVELVVVQPRAPRPGDNPPGVRRWLTDVMTLYEHIGDLKAGAERTKDADAPLVPGDWCKFCKAAAICPALRSRMMKAIGATGRDVLGNLNMADPTKYSADELAQALADLPMVLGWYKAVEKFGHSEACHGRMPPGFKLVKKRGTRKWDNEEVAAVELQLVGLPEAALFEKSMLSPAQVEKLLPKKERDVIESLATSKSSGTSLAPLDDPRPAVDPNDARGFEVVEIADRE